MDAVKFIEERNRMCGTRSEVWGVDAAQIVKNTEEWAAAHPLKTRQSVFLAQYPSATLNYGIIDIKPCQLVRTYTFRDCSITDCPHCRKEYWSKEVK